MDISRSILIQNLNILTQSPDGLNFKTDTDGRLTLTDQATSDAAKEIIAQTFIQAAALEKSENRIWIETGTKAHSLGHLVKEKTHLVPQDVRIQPLEDEVHDLLIVEVMLEGGASYIVHAEESALKKSETIKNMLGDASKGDVIPITDLGLNTDQLDLAFHFIKTGDLPSDLSMTDCAALLRFANFLDHPSFMDKIYQQLNKAPLEKKTLLSLPFELGIQWAKARPTNECVIFLSSFEEKDSLIENIGLELINKRRIKVSDFEDFDQIETIVDPKRIHTLDLSDWKKLTPEAFEKIVKACPEVVSVKAPKHFTDEHLAHVKGLSNLQTLDLTWCRQISNDGFEHLKELKNLQTLDLTGCQQISNAGLAHLQGLKNLQTLDLAYCKQITNDGLAHLQGLKNLQTLDLTWCKQITDDGLAYLKELSNLEILNLHGCEQITNDGLAHLKGLFKLQALNLSSCNNISNDGLAHLKELKNLQTLDLTGCNQITHEAKNELKQLLPQLEIIG